MAQRNKSSTKLSRKVETNERLEQLRNKIDAGDYRLLKHLNLRFKTVEEISRQKKILGIPVLQKGRWQELMEDRLRLVKEELDLDPGFARKLFNLIHEESLRLQRKNEKQVRSTSRK